MNLGDTIVATIGGERSPRGIVRVSGPEAVAGVEALAGASLRTGVARVRLALPVGELPSLALVYRAPRSFSGEDTIELLLPGNLDLLRLVAQELCGRPSWRHALPGEFTARAFLNGRLSAEQSEGVGALIAARTKTEHDAAARLLAGAAGVEYRKLADELASALALLEAGIDFTDQDDVVAISASDLRGRLLRIGSGIDALTGGKRPQETEAVEPVVVLTGAPNAGKSTLFNALLKRQRAVVSEVAGTTRDAIAEVADFAALGWAPGASFAATRVRLVDVAGLDAAIADRAGVDRMAQQAARKVIDDAHVVVWCDPTGRFEAGAEGFRLAGDQRVIRVRTKADLLPMDGAAAAGVVSVCAIDGWHLRSLVRAIQDGVARSQPSGAHGLVPRHARALAVAGDEIERAVALVGDEQGNPTRAELIATSLRAALDELGSIAGKISPDDVIGRIFATFCIGK